MMATFVMHYNFLRIRQTLKHTRKGGGRHQRPFGSVSLVKVLEEWEGARTGLNDKVQRTIRVAAVLLLLLGKTQAEEKEASVEIEIGAAGEWGLPRRGSIFGPSAAIEYTAIKDWLEIEAGISPLFGDGQTEWGAEFLVKKPFSLSDKVEVTLGVGPELLTKTGGAENTASTGGVAVLDFQFWPLPDRKFGWFVEPSYGLDFGKGHQQSLGVTAGLIFAIR